MNTASLLLLSLVLPLQSLQGKASMTVAEALFVCTSRSPGNNVFFGEHRRYRSVRRWDPRGPRQQKSKLHTGLHSRRTYDDSDDEGDIISMMGEPLRKNWFGGSMERDRPQQQQQQKYQQLSTENRSSSSSYENQYQKYQAIVSNNRIDENEDSKVNISTNINENKTQQKQTPNSTSLITPEMEKQVLASAKARMDKDTVSRALSVLIDAKTRETSKSEAKTVSKSNSANNIANKEFDNLQRSIAGAKSSASGASASVKSNQDGATVGGSHILRNLVSRMEPPTDPSNNTPFSNIVNDTINNDKLSDNNSNSNRNNKNDNDADLDDNSSWNTQQIALASGTTTFLLSPLVIPIIHSFLPPILPFPSSLSFEGAAFLGTLSYILAIGDPTADNNPWNLPSNPISSLASRRRRQQPPQRGGGGGGGWIEEGVEVTGAVSRIVGRTALRSAQSTAPRLRAAARAVVEYDTATNTLAELESSQRELTEKVFELEFENDALRRELALWNAVESVSSMYRLEELKEMARYEGVRGYSADGKNALMRRLIREGVLELDLTPFYRDFDNEGGDNDYVENDR
mmetsp:Transcript_7938/g.17448  ORF Transcript_7938/g.17448 Transcript_7938/m.17448 type:complete len:573 (+) Transcript_7938:275-1993(+)